MRIEFVQKIIDKLRNKKSHFGFNDEILKNNNINIPKKNYKNFNVHMEGVNNTIILEENNLNKNARITLFLYGDNNTIIIKKGFILSKFLSVELGRKHPIYGKVKNCRIEIGANTSMESCYITMVNCNSSTNIGSDCMFSDDINLYNTDTHPVFDNTTKKIINRVKGITIGNHCWIGKNVTILKNSEIGNDCIVGWGAIVSGKFNEEHCAIAGNPAKIVKRGITWAPYADGYVSQEEDV